MNNTIDKTKLILNFIFPKFYCKKVFLMVIDMKIDDKILMQTLVRNFTEKIIEDGSMREKLDLPKIIDYSESIANQTLNKKMNAIAEYIANGERTLLIEYIDKMDKYTARKMVLCLKLIQYVSGQLVLQRRIQKYNEKLLACDVEENRSSYENMIKNMNIIFTRLQPTLENGTWDEFDSLLTGKYHQ